MIYSVRILLNEFLYYKFYYAQVVLYYLNLDSSHIIKDNNTLSIIQLSKGNEKVKLSFFIMISPGSLPKGIFILNKNSMPMIIDIIPITIKSLAI